MIFTGRHLQPAGGRPDGRLLYLVAALCDGSFRGSVCLSVRPSVCRSKWSDVLHARQLKVSK